MGGLDFLKKKESKAGGSTSPGASGVPVREVMAMNASGMGNEEIVRELKDRGFSLSQIRDAIAQASVRGSVSGGNRGAATAEAVSPVVTPESARETGPLSIPGGGFDTLEEAPAQQPAQRAAPAMSADIEEIERILEEIIEEKWKDVEDKFNVMDKWKMKMEAQVSNIESRLTEVTARIDSLHQTMASKVEEYDKTMEGVGIEMKALEKVMSKLIPSLSDNIKELRDIVSSAGKPKSAFEKISKELNKEEDEE